MISYEHTHDTHYFSITLTMIHDTLSPPLSNTVAIIHTVRYESVRYYHSLIIPYHTHCLPSYCT